ncbi:MAG: hypothetical protein ABJA69_06225 [Acidobacteriaceae bacterium]
MAEEKKKRLLSWPLGLVATGVAGAAVVLWRGCWHRKMSWPVSSQGCSYQVCTGCGIKRLFDEKEFRAYGPFGYDLERLLTLSDRQKQREPLAFPSERRPAS